VNIKATHLNINVRHGMVHLTHFNLKATHLNIKARHGTVNATDFNCHEFSFRVHLMDLNKKVSGNKKYF